MLSFMGYEVELKFRLTDHGALERRLVDLGARGAPEIGQEDIYLSHPARDFAATGEALRIRRVGDDNRVTYKGPRLSGPTKTREEIELAVTSGEAAFHQLFQLFDHLGFRPVATIRKSRKPFHLSARAATSKSYWMPRSDLGILPKSRLSPTPTPTCRVHKA